MDGYVGATWSMIVTQGMMIVGYYLVLQKRGLSPLAKQVGLVGVE